MVISKKILGCCLWLLLSWVSCGEAPSVSHWQKGNLHTHSLWSDGDDFPEMILQWYKDHGYRFVALSDHNTIADTLRWHRIDARDRRYQTYEKYRHRFGDWVETRTADGDTFVRLKTFEEYRHKLQEADSFLILRSEEVTSGHEKKPVHINVTNLKEKIEPFRGSSVLEVMQQTLDAVHTQRKRLNRPMFAHINHPNFGYGISTQDLIGLRGERFFEVYNGHPAVHNEGDALHIDLEQMWDLVNVAYYHDQKPLMYGIATDDSHNYHVQSLDKSNTGRGWVMVNTPRLDPAGIVTAMERGDFYASSGIALKTLHHDRQKLSLSVDAQAGVDYEILFLGYRKNSDGVQLLKKVKGDRASYTFHPDDIFVRAKINSNAPKTNPYRSGETTQAWTQPLLLP